MENHIINLKENVIEKLLAISPDDILGFIIGVLITIFVAFVSQKISKKIILRMTKKVVARTKNEWDGKLYDRKVFHRLSHIIPGFIILIVASVVGTLFENNIYGEVIYSAGGIYLVITVILVINASLNAIGDILREHSALKQLPINSYIQIIKIAFFGFFGLLLVGDLLIDQSFFMTLIGGIGGISAVSLLVFRDSITGFMSGIILMTNEMVKVGDWIEVPHFNADGEVVDMTLNTVKVKNWDNSITTIPPYSLLSDSFVNWENMQRLSARRIKRHLNIDINSVRFADDDLIHQLVNKKLLSEDILRERQCTNIGLFRQYAVSYLKNHEHIRKDLTCMVRQLQPGEQGIPIEAYAFSGITNWVSYENLQAEIIENFIAVLPSFGLKLHQNPSGSDFQQLSKSNE
ncbi:mechanosensitive ion channel family protein [Vallitalea okinawensis]|uniref:mechanosensitive ion channel family protein n=1 Tax=Vallitalea okinawensis TaxID=2078660 RepID=UPI000CFC8C92|nr:mechanosensitive ion channel domain-containing protein [Vallitalea okinawensis]